MTSRTLAPPKPFRGLAESCFLPSWARMRAKAMSSCTGWGNFLNLFRLSPVKISSRMPPDPYITTLLYSVKWGRAIERPYGIATTSTRGRGSASPFSFLQGQLALGGLRSAEPGFGEAGGPRAVRGGAGQGGPGALGHFE